MEVPAGTKEMFCRPMRDSIKRRDNLPSAEAPGYFQRKQLVLLNPEGIESFSPALSSHGYAG
jgi:hypothetical protein